MKITVVGTGYVGMSMAVLLARHHDVTAMDISEERVNLVNSKKSPIADPEIEKHLTNPLNLKATTDPQEAYPGAEYVIVATPTNYDPKRNYFDTSTVEAVISQANSLNPDATIVIKST
ncbi:MAG: 3-hydroxyacyl-CoA dehydrogenase NAD-binding domain-containing protein, partial [Defluviitaleaceae bacterium]|nr:3-hydroxyacyl-CoA dehydrogenase NAD-binding domain-containing protein [Defluviitaleaceae bacterium]